MSLDEADQITKNPGCLYVCQPWEPNSGPARADQSQSAGPPLRGGGNARQRRTGDLREAAAGGPEHHPVQLAESLTHAGFRTSKAGAFRPIRREKTWKGWTPFQAQS